jgi:GrpB-like predicted nucleotidyltransferase (UPF0157 family)
MLTAGQIKYLEKVPESKRVNVKPFNPKGLEIANQIIAEIKAVEPGLEVICVGSVALKIAGQEDLDINASCVKAEQEKHVPSFKKLYGEPSRIGQASISWDFVRGGFSVDVWLTDPTAETTKQQLKVFNLLKENPQLLKEYEQIKLSAKNMPYKQYQTKKYEFYNRILRLSGVS